MNQLEARSHRTDDFQFMFSPKYEFGKIHHWSYYAAGVHLKLHEAKLRKYLDLPIEGLMFKQFSNWFPFLEIVKQHHA